MQKHNTQLNTTHGSSKNPQIKKITGEEKHMQAGLQAAAFIHMSVFRPISPILSVRVFKNRRACVAEAVRMTGKRQEGDSDAAYTLFPLHSCGVIQRPDLFIPVPQNDNVTIISLLFTGFVVVLKHASQQTWDKYGKAFWGKKGVPNKE